MERLSGDVLLSLSLYRSSPVFLLSVLFTSLQELFQPGINLTEMKGLIPKRPDTSSTGSSKPPEPVAKQPGKNKRRNRTGAGHKKRRQKMSFLVFRRRIRARRKESLRARGAHLAGGSKSVGPKISVRKSVTLDGAPLVSQETVDFYSEHPLSNRYLEVSERANASNPDGVPGEGKGVFAKCDIPAGVRVCPYVGEHKNCPCPPEVECEYDLQMDREIFVCARNTLEDIGYLQSAYPEKDHDFIKADHPNSPNYGRYFNTAMGKGLLDNCLFDIAGDGLDAMFIKTSRDIKQGEELLVDYGDYFFIHEEDRDVDEVDAAAFAMFYDAHHK